MNRMTRRHFSALTAALLAPPAFAQINEAQSITRTIPSTGERVPAVGLGTAGIFDSDDEPTRNTAAQVVRALIDAGGAAH